MIEWLKKNRDKIFLLLILLLTAFLSGYKIWDEVNGNAYYTAAVRSMLTSWHNFFFASFDPGGFITVDKPAVGLWLQCLFGLVFGIHGWSLILPEVLCSVVSVAVLYHIVKRSYGSGAGLLAALFLALTPIFIAASRTNNLDASLVMVCLFAVWAVLAAAEKGSLKHLMLAMALIGLGFNIKMLQAYLYLPALYLVYFFASNIKMKKRVVHLCIATVVLLAVSFSWCIAVDLTPAAERPYVGSSATNSELDLAVGYNGIARVLEANVDIRENASLTSVVGTNAFIANESGQAGILRFFNGEMAGQASWMLTFAIFGLVVLLSKLLAKNGGDKKPVLRQLLLWFGLFAPMVAYFSISGHFHRYYLIMITPCLAALSAIAVSELMKLYARSEAAGETRWQAILLPAAIAVTAAVQVYFLTYHYSSYSKILVPVIIIGAVLSIAGLDITKKLKKENKRLAAAAVAVGLLALLAAPAYWAFCPILYGSNAAIPIAGPMNAATSGIFRMDSGANRTDNRSLNQGKGVQDGFKQYNQAVKPLVPEQSFGLDGLSGNALAGMAGRMGYTITSEMTRYMLDHSKGARFLVAVPNAGMAELLIIQYGVGVMAMGGFRGTDNAISLDGFMALASKGEVQYYWVGGNTDSPITKWVEESAVKVDLSQADGNTGTTGFGNGTLYDLSVLKTAQ